MKLRNPLLTGKHLHLAACRFISAGIISVCCQSAHAQLLFSDLEGWGRSCFVFRSGERARLYVLPKTNEFSAELSNKCASLDDAGRCRFVKLD